MDTEVKDQEMVSEEPPFKKGRHRKKQLYNSILQQMEFYFSDSNLTKDRFLSQIIKQDPFVDLELFLKFNKIRKLTSTITDIQKALKNSKLIQLSEDNTKVCRIEPIKEKTNVDECTIYVERLKSDATHEWISSVFSEFGKVVYVSVPKYKHNNTIKGFAFVEFETEAEAQKALAYFESIGCKMPSNTEPEELCSITTFTNNENNDNAANEGDAEKKRKFEEIEDQKQAENGNEEKRPKLQDNGDEIDADNKKSQQAVENVEQEDSDSKKKKKLKKEHKKKIYIKELGLLVLSKKEWKKMRNRYLDLQKKKMKEFKRYLHRAKFSQPNYDDKIKKPVVEKTPEETLPKLQFVEGVIVKIKLPDPNIDLKKFKNELKSSSSDIQYVDTNSAGDEVFVRFNNSSNAASFCKQESASQSTVITGDDEKTYWDKLLRDREKKFEKGVKKQRGRDKLLKKANKIIATHTKFDE